MHVSPQFLHMFWAGKINSNYCVEVGTNSVMSSSNHDDRHFRGTAAKFKTVIIQMYGISVEAGLHERT
eukprot:12320529-Prorocentrum_lima.AAC.1